jgi:glycosyltransferase involved in cell wall biosynthesis
MPSFDSRPLTEELRTPARFAVPKRADYPGDPRAASLFGGLRVRRSAVQPTPAPLVSIVTIVRNGAARFARAAESVLSQDYPAIEYIVVDGASTDGTLDVIRRLESRIAVWVSEPDTGISDAFNKGIAFAHGEVVGLLNSDDWYEPGAVSAAVRALEESGADIAHGKLQYWLGSRKTYLVTGDADLLEKGMTIGHPTMFVRRACYERLGLYRHDFRQAMDYEWLLRARLSGARFSFVDRCLANMQDGGTGDQRWRESQKEVARARGIHLPAARGAIPYWSYLGPALVRGTVRRMLDALHLSSARRWYHRHLSRIKITHTKE